MSGNEIGKRFKENYENRQRYYLIRRMPIIIRIDGRAFHTFTKSFKRPFDQILINTFVSTTIDTGKEMSGFKLAYCQSDEVSFLLTDYDELNTPGWFDYNKGKIESISASVFTGYFIKYLSIFGYLNDLYKSYTKLPSFDSRAFNIPKDEVTNYFLWRALDWKRNSVSMYCGQFFSAKQMLNKGQQDQHELLYSIGKNWTTDLSTQIKNGSFIMKDVYYTNIEPNYKQINELIDGKI